MEKNPWDINYDLYKVMLFDIDEKKYLMVGGQKSKIFDLSKTDEKEYFGEPIIRDIWWGKTFDGEVYLSSLSDIYKLNLGADGKFLTSSIYGSIKDDIRDIALVEKLEWKDKL